MASYSTEEKANKAMKMLQEAYRYMRQFETTYVGTIYFPSRPQYHFQFPKDEEIEL